jgi:peroxiredoxin
VIPALIALVLAAGAAALVRHRLTSHLARGRKAPDFSAHGALDGTVHDFSLREALRHGPVVLYFYPKSFTSGCTVEAHAFAERIPEFEAAGATVVGISGDSIETQQRFSRTECGGKFVVLSDPGFIAKRYGVTLAPGVPNRTSYVIARDGTIADAFTSMFEPLKHVEAALKSVNALGPRAAGSATAAGASFAEVPEASSAAAS